MGVVSETVLELREWLSVPCQRVPALAAGHGERGKSLSFRGICGTGARNGRDMRFDFLVVAVDPFSGLGSSKLSFVVVIVRSGCTPCFGFLKPRTLRISF